MQTEHRKRPILSLRRQCLPAARFEPAPAATLPPTLTSEHLFGAEREILIAHADQVYRMRKTRLGKLILIK